MIFKDVRIDFKLTNTQYNNFLKEYDHYVREVRQYESRQPWCFSYWLAYHMLLPISLVIDEYHAIAELQAKIDDWGDEKGYREDGGFYWKPIPMTTKGGE